EFQRRASERQRRNFVDGSQTDKMVEQNWSHTAPKWRKVDHGLTIEGICENTGCEAKGKMVIFNSQFIDFDLFLSQAVCPMCGQQFKPVKPGFNNCMWRIDYQKLDGSVSKIPWRKNGDRYQTYNQKEAGMAEFTRLIIHVRETNTSKSKPAKEGGSQKNEVSVGEYCSICHERQDAHSTNVVVMKCGHSFHADCIQNWKDLNLRCPLCDNPMEDA
ncbi:MAG: putative ring and ubiquitin domain containing protein, partial [Streblomastix strix]